MTSAAITDAPPRPTSASAASAAMRVDERTASSGRTAQVEHVHRDVAGVTMATPATSATGIVRAGMTVSPAV